jgi:AraC-like DNA-binding protein
MAGPLPVHELDIPPPDKLPFAIGSFETIGPLSRADFPHRHTFYEIAFVTKGQGAHVVDLAERELRPPMLCFVMPGQVHFWRRAVGLEGKVILFTDEFLEAYPRDREVLHRLECLALSRKDGAAFGAVTREMEEEYRQRAPGCTAILQACLHILLLRASRLSCVTGAPPPGGGAASVARKFVALLGLPGGHLRTVQGSARRIGVSPAYLNEAVKSVLRRTPGQLIRQAQLLEAKRLLARTELTVQQVAKELGFADPSYFCRFFRREQGQTPGDFRRTSGKHHDHRDRPIDGDASGSSSSWYDTD